MTSTSSTRKSPRLTPRKENEPEDDDILPTTMTPIGETSVEKKKSKKDKKSSEKKSKKKSKKNKEKEGGDNDIESSGPMKPTSKDTEDNNDKEQTLLAGEGKSSSSSETKTQLFLEEPAVESSQPTETTVATAESSEPSSSTRRRRHRSRSEDRSKDEEETPIAGMDDSKSSSKKKNKKDKKQKKEKGERPDSSSKKEKKSRKRSSSMSEAKDKVSSNADEDDLGLSSTTPPQHNSGNDNNTDQTPMDIASPQEQHQAVEGSQWETPQKESIAVRRSTTTDNDKPEHMEISPEDDGEDNVDAVVPATPLSKPPPTMDVLVHRVRYLQFRPSAILCMAVTPIHTITNMNATTNNNDNIDNNNESSSQDQQHQQQWLALSRQNGSVELRGADEKFRVMASVAGLRQKTVDCMTWVCGNHAGASSSSSSQCRPTLMGGSNDGTLFCIHFARGQLANMIPSGGGAIFCLQSLCGVNCSSPGGCRRLVAAGCEDGAVRIFQLQDSQSHQDDHHSNPPQAHLVSTIPSAGAAILSLAWRHFPGSKGGAGSVILFAGVADGTIRRYDCHESAANNRHDENEWTGRQWKSSHRMTVECYGRNTPTRVWKLLLLADGTVVSGDSLGHVQFWDGHTGTLLQGFDQNDCKADVLDLAISSDETKVFASGVDSRVVCIERTTMTHYRQKWILSHAQRPHTHDVKAMAICRRMDRFGASSTSAATTPTSAPEMDDVLCTGGIDTKICTYLVKKFQKVRPRNIYPWPSQSHISFATESRVLLMRREDKVDLYQLNATPSDETSADLLVVPDGNALVGSIEIKSLGNLVCSDISKSGQFISISDHATLLVFKMQYTKNGDGSVLAEPQRVTLPEILRVPCLAVKFVSNDKFVASTTAGTLYVVSIEAEEESAAVDVRLLQTLRVRQNSFFPVDDVCIASNQRWIATFRNGVGAGTIQVFRRTDDKDSYEHWWSLPALDSSSSAVHFIENPTSPTMLAVACCNFALYMFDVQNKTLSQWSEANGFPVSRNLPLELKYRNDVPVRIAFNPTSPQKILVGSFGAFALMNLERKMPSNCRVFPERHVRGSSRKRQRTMSCENEKPDVSAVEESKNCTICLRYNSMLHMDFIANNEMLVVEQPWLDVVATFPAALERKVYGNQ